MLLVVPQTLQTEKTELAHDGSGGGHLDLTKTVQTVRRSFFWIGCAHDVKLWVRQCTKCQSKKSPNPIRQAALMLAPVDAPMERIAIAVLWVPYRCLQGAIVMYLWSLTILQNGQKLMLYQIRKRPLLPG